MGWRGTIRSVGAAMRAANREAERSRKIALKSRLISASAEAVDALDEYLENLVSIHTDLGQAVDWEAIARLPRPNPPPIEERRRMAAERALANLRPRFFDPLIGGTWKRRRNLEQQVTEAIEADGIEHDNKVLAYQAALADWETDGQLATRVVAGEQAALREVIGEMQTFTTESRIGAQVIFEIADNFVHAKPEIHTTDIVPKIRRKQLASGALSESKMPAAQFNELYQDYVASVVLRVAGDLLNTLPLREVYVTCVAEMLNASTGHREKTPILSVHVPRETFSRLNLATVDPSDAMSNFRHNMKFKRSSGFEPIVPSGTGLLTLIASCRFPTSPLVVSP